MFLEGEKINKSKGSASVTGTYKGLGCGDGGGDDGGDDDALPQPKSVLRQTLKDPSTSIENILQNGHGCKEMVVVDKSQSI